ncbi:MAG: hypothetical protein AAGA56_14485 [Myxococcota bacterium]
MDVVWRVYGEPAELTAAVPEDYSGWFLQLRDRLGTDDGGLMVRSLSVADGLTSVTISGQWSDVALLWRVASSGLAALPGVQFSCGNVAGAGAEWPEYLRRLPDPNVPLETDEAGGVDDDALQPTARVSVGAERGPPGEG